MEPARSLRAIVRGIALSLAVALAAVSCQPSTVCTAEGPRLELSPPAMSITRGQTAMFDARAYDAPDSLNASAQVVVR
jgi:hypothetical protein